MRKISECYLQFVVNIVSNLCFQMKEKSRPQNMRSISLRTENYFSSYRRGTGTCKCSVDSKSFNKDEGLWWCTYKFPFMISDEKKPYLRI
jgi:hypothetical protein